MIREFGEGTPIPYPLVEDWAMIQFDDHKKGLSTIKAKCRSIWNWNDKRDWVLPKHYIKKNQKEVLMTRQENMNRVNANKNAKAQAKIRSVLEDVFVHDTLRFKNGKLKMGVIAKLVEMDYRTVSKHLKEMGLV